MFENKTGVFLIAASFLFLLSIFVVAIASWTVRMNEHEMTIMDIAEEGFVPEFVELAERFPEHFLIHYPGGVTEESYAEALELGRKVYVGEACWHCHSQQVRSVSSDELRWGPVSRPEEYQNILHRPVLFGTRRVGPDLAREGGRRSNDWHLAHFYKPVNVVATSVMPGYPWFFDDNGYPNKRGIAIITYMQWLGSWLDVYPYYYGDDGPYGSQSTTADALPLTE